jgi:hypothetical protein
VNGSVGPLLAANVLYLAIGAGLLPLLRVARSWRQLAVRGGLAYFVGLAVAGILSSDLALASVAIELPELTVLALASLALGWWRLRREPPGAEPERAWTLTWPRTELAVAGGAAATLLLLVAHAWRTFRVRPLLEWDGWAIWATKARALYDYGGTFGPIFRSESYGPLQHPLLLPSLEAIGFRAMGTFDGTTIHVQLLWERVPPAVLALATLALVAATPVLTQLATNQADIPLAFFVGLGVGAIARWLRTDEGWALACGALFLGAATLTKSDGLMFALTTFLALGGVLLVSARPRLGRAGLAALAVVAAFAPWRAYVAVHHLRVADYRFSNLVSWSYLSDHADRAWPALHGLFDRVVFGGWGFVPLLVGLSLAAAFAARRFAVGAFAAAWLALSFAGLVLIYWIDRLPVDLALTWSSSRTVTSLVVGGAALAPLLVAEVWEPALAGAPRLARGVAWRRPRVAFDARTWTVAAFASLALAYAFVVQPVGCNQTSHYALVKSLSHGTAHIDRYHWETCDEGWFRGHYFSNKAPGLAALTLPLYEVLHAAGVTPGKNTLAAVDSPIQLLGVPRTPVWALGLLGNVLPALLLLLLVRALADRVEPGLGTAAAVTLGVGTLVLPFATMFFSHALSALLGFAAFALLWRERDGPRSRPSSSPVTC